MANRTYLFLMLMFALHSQVIAGAASIPNKLKSPLEFFGYELGTRFTPHHRLVAYAEHVAEKSDRVRLQYYGETYEQRPLFVLFVSSPENLANLETIRTDNQKRAAMIEGETSTQVPIAWFSFNVHGNEAVGVETALMMLWTLVDPAGTPEQSWLSHSLVVIDPCLNPDGHARYVNWYTQKANWRTQPDPQSSEHAEPWPGGRPNHYLFDLNRDWAWQVQKESQLRIALYNQWLPQVHVDVHEQGVDAPYFFAPAAEPVHEMVTDFQREFQSTVGKNIARQFDQHAWLYFTREEFDLFYPSYGDTWPTFNGAVGMTYEQGGSGRAGLAILTGLGDTLTLNDRIIHHYTAALATLEMVHQHRLLLLEEFEKFFHVHSTQPKGNYKAYVLKTSQAPARLQPFIQLLQRNDIRYAYANRTSKVNGYSYTSGKQEELEIAPGDLVLSAYQPKSILLQTLMDPNPHLSDSLTYDITTWALPYAFGLQAFALNQALPSNIVSSAQSGEPINFSHQLEPSTPYTNAVAYVCAWNAGVHAKFLASLFQANFRVRYATQVFQVDGKAYGPGTLIIGREGNSQTQNFDTQVQDLAARHQVQVLPISTGYMELGRDLGSSAVRALKAPKVGLFSGKDVSSLGFGELWHYFEQELEYPLSILDVERINALDLSAYQVLILPAGDYRGFGETGYKKLQSWVSSGGKLIAIGSALSALSGKDGFEISSFLDEDEKKKIQKRNEEIAAETRLLPYAERERASVSHQVSGAVYQVHVDSTHPLGYGLNGTYHTLRNHTNRFVYLKNGVNVGTIRNARDHRSGFVGYAVRDRVEATLVFGEQRLGKGYVVYFVDDPIFRGFWEPGKLLLSNALFLVGQ